MVEKPPGLLTSNLPGERRDSVFDFVKEHVKRQRRGGKAWIVHRLDKEASGLLVFAKSEKAFTWLKEDFKSKRVHRLYVAVVEGDMRGAPAPAGAGQTEGTIQSQLIETRTGRVKSVPAGEFRPSARSFSDEGARLAVTHYRVLGVGKDRTMLQVRLGTGRKHQIRAHLSEAGHPILGDQMYGARSDPLNRLALHANELGFTHPGTGQMTRYRSPAPPAFFHAVGMRPPPVQSSDPPAAAVAAPARRDARGIATETSWDEVADWYDELIGRGGEGRSDHYERIILPGAIRLLGPRPGMHVLDVACGQGVLCRQLAGLGVDAVGVDASPRLIEAARSHGAQGPGNVTYLVGDGRELSALDPAAAPDGAFDAATCVMALMNIDQVEPVLRGCAAKLREGGAFVAVILHPAFRAPGQTSWGWAGGSDGVAERRSIGKRTESRPPAEAGRQFRRVDGYLSPGQSEIVMNPGGAAHGKRAVTTWTFHRPIQTYVRALREAGFLIEALEEWPSARRSQPGPRAAEENRARREIPLFLGLRAVKWAGAHRVGTPPTAPGLREAAGASPVTASPRSDDASAEPLPDRQPPPESPPPVLS